MVRAGPALAPREFAEVRRRMALDGCKWDPQVGDVRVIAPFPLLLGRGEWERLARTAEALYAETERVEAAVMARPDLQKRIGVPRALRRVLARVGDGAEVTPTAARVMRFDFHPTADGWRVSEVNADVPGGYAEAWELARLVAGANPGYGPAGDPAGALVEAIARRAGDGAIVALLWAPGYMEDLQVVSYLARRLEERGMRAVRVAPGQLHWSADGRAVVRGVEQAAVVRFFQAEWLPGVRGHNWARLLVGGRTPVTNPAGAIIGESKRLPLVWDDLPFEVPVWRAALPETRELRDAPWRADDGWVIKAAYGNTGDAVAGRAITPPVAWRRAARAARLRPGRWVAQRRFETAAVESPAGPVFPCLGVYVIDGKAAGAYGRVTAKATIDFEARDVAVLVEEVAG
ncbi:MAG: glutathionylspermidine synthase family protein [Phycisphaerae bacterium]|nr:glutathionylspermidine synthase family protein [Tepidisphaeraceae bacterium]